MTGPVSFEDWERQRLDRATGVVTTVSPDGGPHAAAVIVSLTPEGLRFETETDSRKYKNLVKNPRVAILVFGQPKWGVLVRGSAEVLGVDEHGQAQILLRPATKASWRRKES